MENAATENQTNQSNRQQHRWIRAAIAGDKQALAWLLEELTPAVQERAMRALFRYSTKSQGRSVYQEVEDLSQDIFLWLFEKEGKVLKSWKPNQGVPLVGFIGFVVDRKLMGIMRTHKRSPWTEEPTLAEELDQRQNLQSGVLAYAALGHHQTDPENRIASKQLLQLVVKKLNDSVSPLGRCLFCLLYVEQHSVEEVGQHMGMSADAVYAWRSRLGRKSREILHQIKEQESPRRARTSPTKANNLRYRGMQDMQSSWEHAGLVS